MNKEALNKLVYFLKTAEIPIIKKNPKTFLGIAKQPHYENVLSNILAFYFDVNDEHGFENLFINSLQEIIKQKTNKTINLNTSFDIITEYTTDNGGRIDLLLQSKEQAIIIENKVYHHLKDNDLDDYFNTIKLRDDNKVIIVLSLKPEPLLHSREFNNIKHFVNITHFEFLSSVIKNLPNYATDKNKYFYFLEDLYQNIKNLSNKNMKPEELQFYFNNQDKINKAKELYFGTRNYIKTAVENAGYSIKGFNKYNPKNIEEKACYYVCPSNKDLMIMVKFDTLLNSEKKLSLIVKLQNELTQNKENYNSIKFSENEATLLVKAFYNDTKNWAHFAIKEFMIEEIDLPNLSDFIQKELSLDKPIRQIYKKVKNIII